MARLRITNSHLKTLRNATHSRYIFLEDDGKRIYLDTRDGTTNQLDLFEVFVARSEQILRNDGLCSVRYWIPDASSGSLGYIEGQAELVLQLREGNANRFLHEAGHNQSRIGVDFINCSKEDAAALNESKDVKK